MGGQGQAEKQINMTYTVVQGWLQQAKQVLSPNCGPRPDSCAPELLVIHNISLPPSCYGGDCIERLFTNCLDWDEHPYFDEIRGLEVSAHLLIRRDGELVQFVSFDQRAWHAGQSCFEGRENCNDFSIGIELEGEDEDPYSDEQYAALSALTAALLRYYPALKGDRIVGHSDIAPGRKTDPGPAFDWPRYRVGLVTEGEEL
jgi:AmpD protein